MLKKKYDRSNFDTEKVLPMDFPEIIEIKFKLFFYSTIIMIKILKRKLLIYYETRNALHAYRYDILKILLYKVTL